MAIANPTAALALERQVTGTNNDAWNERYCANFARTDAALTSLDIDVSTGDATLTAADSADLAADAQTRPMYVRLTGSPAAPLTISWPSATPKRFHLVKNLCGKTVTLTTIDGTLSFTLPNLHRRAVVVTDGGVEAADYMPPEAGDGESILLPSGQIIKAGIGTTSAGGTAAVRWAVPFPTACLSVQVTPIGVSSREAMVSAVNAAGLTISIRDLTGSGLVGADFYITALGN